MHTYSICFQLFPFKHRLIADKTASFKVLQLRFACPVTCDRLIQCDKDHTHRRNLQQFPPLEALG